VPVTLLIAGAAWLLSGDPVRALAVLVVATPCPLILAAPVAIVSGMSQAARRGVIVKDGGALETLARARMLLLDKTGTLTAGAPRLRDIRTFGRLEPDALLRLAASLDQASPHPLASAIVVAARQRGLALSFPSEVEERHGAGIHGMVDDHSVALGNAEWAAGAELPPTARALGRHTALDGTSCVFAAVDGRLTGAMVLEDPSTAGLHKAASGRARGCGGGALPADPLVAPVAHGPEDGYQRPAELAHRILDPRGNLRVDGPDDQLVALQLAKLLGEHLLGHLGDQPAKTAEALRRLLEVPQDERLPLAPDRLERRLHSAVPPAAGNRPHGRSLPSDAARTIPDGARRAPYRPSSMYLTSEWVLPLRAGVGHSWPRRTGRGREPR